MKCIECKATSPEGAETSLRYIWRCQGLQINNRRQQRTTTTSWLNQLAEPDNLAATESRHQVYRLSRERHSRYHVAFRTMSSGRTVIR